MAQIETLGFAADPKNPLYTTGKYVRTVVGQIAVSNAGSAAGDIYKIARGLPVDTQVLAIRLPRGTAQIAGMDDVDFGFYRSDNEDVLDIDVLVDGADFATAVKASGVDLLESGLTSTIGGLLNLASDSEPAGGVDLCATLKAKPTATGTVTVFIDLAFTA